MAYLIPENLPSRPDIHAQLQVVAAALRDRVSDDVTVWLEEGDDRPYLLILDPNAGILLLDAPPTDRRRRRTFKFGQPEMSVLESKVAERHSQLRARIRAEQRLSDLPTATAVALPHLDSSEATGLVSPGVSVISRKEFEDGNLHGALVDVLGRGTTRLTERDERILRGIVKPEIVISGRAHASDNGQLVFRPPDVDSADVIRVLDRQQEQLARHLGPGYRVIRGVAGSGKTLVLTFRARFIAENWPQWKILVTCFNRTLARALGEYLSDTANVTVQHIDSIAWRMAGKPRVNRGEWGALRESAVTRARVNHSGDRYDVVLVDEAQDFETAQLELAHLMLKPGRDDFIIALDSAQNIYRKRSRWNPPNTTARGRTTLLRTNYRNTKEILEFAFHFLSDGKPISTDELASEDPDVIVPPEATSRRGPAPRVITCAGRQEEVEAVAHAMKELNGRGVRWSSMAVIYGASSWQTALYYECKKQAIPYHWVTRNSRSKDEIMAAGNAVRVSTAQSLKGLEFSRVFVCGADQISSPDDDHQSVKRLLYVAMTRAVDELTLTVSGAGPITAALQAASLAVRNVRATGNPPPPPAPERKPTNTSRTTDRIEPTPNTTPPKRQDPVPVTGDDPAPRFMSTRCRAPGCTQPVQSNRLCATHTAVTTGEPVATRLHATSAFAEVVPKVRSDRKGRQVCPKCRNDYPARWERCGSCNAPNPRS